MVDHPRVQRLIRELLEAIGEDPEREGLLETPRRVADMYVELFGDAESDPGAHLRTTFEVVHDEMVMVRDIPFTSLCEHHLVPFVGVAHVAYLPGSDGFARRLQVQERMTTQIVEAMENELHPRGSIVVLEAEHFCMSMRGVKKDGMTTVTSAVRGAFRDEAATRGEALAFIHQRRSTWR